MATIFLTDRSSALTFSSAACCCCRCLHETQLTHDTKRFFFFIAFLCRPYYNNNNIYHYYYYGRVSIIGTFYYYYNWWRRRRRRVHCVHTSIFFFQLRERQNEQEMWERVRKRKKGVERVLKKPVPTRGFRRRIVTCVVTFATDDLSSKYNILKSRLLLIHQSKLKYLLRHPLFSTIRYFQSMSLW